MLVVPDGKMELIVVTMERYGRLKYPENDITVMRDPLRPYSILIRAELKMGEPHALLDQITSDISKWIEDHGPELLSLPEPVDFEGFARRYLTPVPLTEAQVTGWRWLGQTVTVSIKVPDDERHDFIDRLKALLKKGESDERGSDLATDTDPDEG